jgi:chromosome segregation ATPase
MATSDAKCADFSHTIQRLSTENADMRARLEAEVATLAGDLAHLGSRQQAKERTVQEQRELCRQLSQQNQILQDELRTANATNERLSTELAELRKELSLSETAASESAHKYREALQKVRSTQKQTARALEERTQEIEAFKRASLTKEQKLAEYSTKLTEITRLVSEAETMKASLCEEVAFLKAQNKRADLVNSELTGRINAMSQELKAAVSETQRLREHSDAFSASFFRLKKQNEASSAKEAELKQRIQALKSGIREKEAQCSALQEQVKVAEGERSDLHRQHQILTALLEKARRQVTPVKQLPIDPDLHKREKDRLEETIAGLKEGMAAKASEYERQLRLKDCQLESMAAKVAFLEQRTQLLKSAGVERGLGQERRRMERLLQRLKDELEHLRSPEETQRDGITELITLIEEICVDGQKHIDEMTELMNTEQSEVIMRNGVRGHSSPY